MQCILWNKVKITHKIISNFVFSLSVLYIIKNPPPPLIDQMLCAFIKDRSFFLILYCSLRPRQRGC